MKRKLVFSIGALLVLMLLQMVQLPEMSAAAANAEAIEIGLIDYDALTMVVYTNGNSIVYYSTNKSTWYEVEGLKNAENTAYLMDISWVSAAAETTLYFKGETVEEVVSVTLPKRNTSLKVKYDKAAISFEFDNIEDAETFEWRKSTDYTWYTVSMETESASYQRFMEMVEGMLGKGGKLVFRTPQVVGTGEAEVGTRPSKEVTVSLAKRANAPSVKVYQDKLTVNTTEKMEYYDANKDEWIACTKSMTIKELAPEALYENGGESVVLQVRTAATEKKSYSKTAYLTIPGQKAPVSLGDSTKEVSYWYQDGKLMLQFNQASSTATYSYAVVKAGQEFDPSTAKFKAVKNNKVIKLSASAAPVGSTIYVRKSGTAYSASKGVALVLASAENSFVVTSQTK